MTLTFDKLTPELITNLYLYGQIKPPTNLVDDKLIRPKAVTSSVDVNVNSFMAGPGRFAVGAQFELVKGFFNSRPPLPGYQISPGIYTKEQLAAYFGLSNDYGWNMKHIYYRDQVDDYAERVYIYNSQRFKISDRARFVVNADGTREIVDFYVEPLQDNFDFVGGGIFASIGNAILEPLIDPSKIGRTVNINFTGTRTEKTYDKATFEADRLKIASWGGLASSTLYNGIIKLSDKLFNEGITKFIDKEEKPIIYGTQDNNKWSVVLAKEEIYPKLFEFFGNGVVLIGAGGNDELLGYHFDDRLFGGQGNDILSGGRGNDALDGGLGNDTVDYSLETTPITLTLTKNPDPKLTGFNGTVKVGSDTDTLSSIETLKFTKKDDIVKIQSIPQGVTLDGGEGKDTLDFSTANPKVGVQVDSTTKVVKLGSDSLSITNFEIFVGTAYNDIFKVDEKTIKVDGGEGIDLLDFSNSSKPITVDLVKSGTGIPQYIKIENFKGSSFNDVFTLDKAANKVEAGNGNDIMIGGAGNDTLDGGLGNDTVDYSLETIPITLTLVKNPDPKLTGFNGTVKVGSDTDTLSSIETPKFTKKDDIVKIQSLPKGVTLDAVDGKDTLDFSTLTTTLGVSINTTAKLAQVGSESLSIANFETFVGTNRDDTFKVDENTIQVDGGAGKKDILDFAGSKQGIVINDSTRPKNIIAKNIEEYIGSAYKDRIKGTAADEIFRDGAGDDVIFGGGGNDIFYNGLGNDVYASGESGDQFIFSGNFGKDGIADTKKGVAIKIGNIDLSTVEWSGISFFGVGRFKNASKTLMLDTDGVSGLITDSSGNELLLGNAFANGVFNIL